MYDIKNFQTEVNVASAIGKIVGQKIGYRHLDILSSPGFQEAQFLKFQNDNGEVKYLNVFIIPSGENWKISAVGMIVDDDCFSDLTDEEREKVWHFGTTYIYEHKAVSMCDITAVDVDTIISYVSPNASPEKIVIDKATVAKRKKVSVIISEWFETERAIKDMTADASEDMKAFAKTHNMRTNVIETIVQRCMEAKGCVKKNVSYNGNGTDVKVTAALLSKDNRIYTLFLSVDEEHVGLFYLENANGTWSKRLLPDSIGEVAELFKEKTR